MIKYKCKIYLIKRKILNLIQLGGTIMKEKFRVILLYVSIAVFSISMAYIVYNKYTMYRENQEFEELQTSKSEASISESEENKENNSTSQNGESILEEKRILPEYESLHEENSDLYGWIKIEDSVIDYPIMYTPDNPNFYLYRNWQRKETSSGSIFIDGRSNEDTENLIVYGHNMKNGTMFGSLDQYKEKDYYEQHKYIQLDTIYEKATYEVIAVSKAIVYYENKPQDEYLFYEHIELNSEDEFNEYISYMKENSYYEIDSTAEYGDKIITLCTCDYWTDNARLLIVAKKIK